MPLKQLIWKDRATGCPIYLEQATTPEIGPRYVILEGRLGPSTKKDFNIEHGNWSAVQVVINGRLKNKITMTYSRTYEWSFTGLELVSDDPVHVAVARCITEGTPA